MVNRRPSLWCGTLCRRGRSTVCGNLRPWGKRRGSAVSDDSLLERVAAAAEERHPFGEHLTACRVPGSNELPRRTAEGLALETLPEA